MDLLDFGGVFAECLWRNRSADNVCAHGGADESKNTRFLYEIYINTFPRLAKYAVKR